MQKSTYTVICLFLLVYLVNSVYAVDYWDNAVNLYPSSTTKWEAVREIQNGDVNPMDVKVDYLSSSNITALKKYALTGNETTFVLIENGVVTKSSGVKRLYTGDSLVFNIEASPSDSVSEGQTVSVTVVITRTEVRQGQGPITIFPDFDILILSLPNYVVQLWTPQTSLTVQLVNTANVGVETKLAYWVENQLNKTVYQETLTFYIDKKETKMLPVFFPTPLEPGFYSFHASVIDPNVEASAQRSFGVYTVVSWLLGPALFLTFIIIVVAIAIVVYVGWREDLFDFL